MENNFKHHIILTCWFILCAGILIPTLQAQFTIEPGSWVTVKEGGSMMIGTDFHIKSVPDSSGYFVDQTIGGDVTITGNITVERYMTPAVWHNMASPVSNETRATYPGTDLVFYYDETLVWNNWNFGWVWCYGVTADPLLQPFRGYDVYDSINPQTILYNAISPAGLNTGDYVTTVTRTGYDPETTNDNNGWNLVGNPYPSPVDWMATGWNKANINDAKYIWDGTDSTYSLFEGGKAPIGLSEGTRFIPSNQGFWVQAVQTGSFGISNSVRVGEMTGTPDFYKDNPADYPLVSLIATGNNKSDEVLVRFIEGTTDGFDVNYDASKLFSPSPNVPQIGINAGNHTLALSTLPELKDNLEVPLNFQCGIAGYYTINLSARTYLDELTKLYLKDEILKKIINLTADSAYVFHHDPGNDPDRFRLYFNPSEDIINNISPEDWFSVYSAGNMITIIKNTTKEISGDIIIYNILGQPVYHKHFGNIEKSVIQVNLQSGYYIVSVVTANHVSNSKILICN